MAQVHQRLIMASGLCFCLSVVFVNGAGRGNTGRPSKSPVVPETCPMCVGIGNMGIGSFGIMAPKLIRYRMPAAPVVAHELTEPWVYWLTLNKEGSPCAIEAISGPDATLSPLIAAAIKTWAFAPMVYKTNEICFKSRLYVYLRSKGNRKVFVIPGVTEAF